MLEVMSIVFKYTYLALLWGFVISVVAFIRRDIFQKNKQFANVSVNKIPANAQNIASDNLPNTPANISTAVPVGVSVINGIAEGDYFDLTGFELSIGRDYSNIIQLDDSFVSSKHARIFIKNNKYYIEDLKSTNGTNVDGEKIKGLKNISLGSRISIGNNVLELV